MDYKDKFRISTVYTAFGSQFCMYPVHSGGPAPTLLLFAESGSGTLGKMPLSAVGRLLHDRGWNVVSVDLPCHGANQRIDEPENVQGWARRISEGEEITADFLILVNDTLGHIVGTGIAQPNRIAAAGVSHGAFMAFHAAANNPSIKAIAAMAPVTDLAFLKEFSGMAENPVLQKLALTGLTKYFKGRRAWVRIGSDDKRAGTALAAAFAQALTDAECTTLYRESNTPGHIVPIDWHSDAALWLQTAVE